MAQKDIRVSLDRTNRNNHNDNYTQLFEGVQQVKKTIDDLVLESGGDSNLEVVQARGGESTLNSRLDKLDDKDNELASQLADEVHKRQSDFIMLDNKKADVIYVNNKFENVLDGTPREVFNSKSDLESEYPEGRKGVFLVIGDDNVGYLYSWSGNDWTKLTQYQSQGIADNSVGLNKLTFLPVSGVRSKNLFGTDFLEIAHGEYIYNVDGKLRESETGEYNGTVTYIPIDGSSYYTISHMFDIAFYDHNKEFIEGVRERTDEVYTFKTPENAKYIRVSIKDEHMDDYQLEKGAKATPYEKGGLKLKDDYVGINNVTFPLFVTGGNVNLFDKDNMTFKKGYYIYSQTGDLQESASGEYYAVETFIPIIPESKYIISNPFDLAFYDKNKVFLKGLRLRKGEGSSDYPVNSYDEPLQFEAPKSAVYVRLSIHEDYLNDYYFTFGKISKDQIDNSILSGISILEGKKWGVMGDSNSDLNNSHANKKYQTIIAEQTGVVLNSVAIASYSWTGEHNGHKLYEQIDLLESDCDYVTFLCGGNDVRYLDNGTIEMGEFGNYDDGTFYGELDHTISQLVKKFPLTKIGALSQFKRAEGKEELIQDMVKALKKVCGKYSIPVLDLYNGGNVHAFEDGYSDEAMTDGRHLSNLGHELMSNKIKTFLESL